MSSALIICSESDTPFHRYANIAVINVFLLNKLKKKGVNAVDLFGIDPGIDEPKVVRKIDFLLHKEAEDRAEMRWAPLALVRTTRRYLHYLQFKNRIGQWLSDLSPTSLVISSGWDKDLIAAASMVCKKRGIHLEVQDGAFDIYSGLEPFISAETLPSHTDISPLFLIIILGWWTRLRRISVIYEPYSNLGTQYLHAQTFKWWKTVSTRGYTYKRFVGLLGVPDSTQGNIELPIYVNPDYPSVLNQRLWSEFPDDELQAINSGLHGFSLKYSEHHLDRIYNALKLFFKISKTQRFIVLDSKLSHSRMLTYAAKQSGLHVDFLPHGMTIEDYTSATGNSFNPDRVLAWNVGSRDRYRKLGMNACAVSHARNKSWLEAVRREAKPIQNMKVLVLLSSSESLQLDALERDFLNVHAALEALGVQHVKWRAHNAGPKIAESRNLTLFRVQQLLAVNVEFAEPSLDTQQLMCGFDMLVIGGVTSGIFEAARFGIPFVVFGGQLDRVGSLDGFLVPRANSKETLIDVIRDFGYEAHRVLCGALRDSLIAGPDPFNEQFLSF